MNNKVIKLTESEFYDVISEAVSRVLNEVGNTSRGQFMLGRLYQKQEDYGDKKKSDKTYKYTINKAKKMMD